MTGGAGCDQTNEFHCPGQSDTEYKTEFSIWSITAASMLVATDIRNMTSIMQEILLNEEVLAVNQDKMRVAGGRVGFHDCSEGKQFCQIWAKPLEGGSKAVVLYNSGKEDHDIVLDFGLLGWEGKTVKIRDLWAHKDLGSFTGEFQAKVVSHGSTMLNLTLAV
jgi:alpha-galactosidase